MPTLTARPVNSTHQALTLVPVLPGSADVALTLGPMTLGSAADCDVVLQANGVAGLHATIITDEQRSVIVAHDARCWLNDGPVKQAVFHPGDRLAVGPVEFRLELGPRETPVARTDAPQPATATNEFQPHTDIVNAQRPAAGPASGPDAQLRVLEELLVQVQQQSRGLQLPDSALRETVDTDTETLKRRQAELSQRAAALESEWERIAALDERTQAAHTRLEERLRQFEQRESEFDEHASQMTSRPHAVPDVNTIALQEQALTAELQASQVAELELHWQHRHEELDTQYEQLRRDREALDLSRAKLQTRELELQAQTEDLDVRVADIAELDRQSDEIREEQADRQEAQAGFQQQQQAFDERQEALESHERETQDRLEDCDRRERDLEARHEQAGEREREWELRCAEFEVERARLDERAATLRQREEERNSVGHAVEDDRQQAAAEREQLGAWQERLGSLDGEINADNEQLELIRAELDEQREEIREVRETFADERAVMQSLREELAEQELDIQSARDQMDRERAESESLSQRLTGEREELDAFRTAIGHDRESASAAHISIDARQAELDAREREIEGRSSDVHAALAGLKDQRDALAGEQARIEVLRHCLDDDHTIFEGRQSELEQLWEELRDRQTQVEALEGDFVATRESLEQTGQSIDEARIVLQAEKAAGEAQQSALVEEQTQLAVRHTELTEHRALLENRLQQASARDAECRSREAELADREVRLIERERDLKRQSQAAQSGSTELNAEQDELQPERRAELEGDRDALERERIALESRQAELHEREADVSERRDEVLRDETELERHHQVVEHERETLLEREFELDELKQELEDRQRAAAVERCDLETWNEKLQLREDDLTAESEHLEPARLELKQREDALTRDLERLEEQRQDLAQCQNLDTDPGIPTGDFDPDATLVFADDGDETDHDEVVCDDGTTVADSLELSDLFSESNASVDGESGGEVDSVSAETTDEPLAALEDADDPTAFVRDDWLPLLEEEASAAVESDSVQLDVYDVSPFVDVERDADSEECSVDTIDAVEPFEELEFLDEAEGDDSAAGLLDAGPDFDLRNWGQQPPAADEPANEPELGEFHIENESPVPVDVDDSAADGDESDAAPSGLLANPLVFDGADSDELATGPVEAEAEWQLDLEPAEQVDESGVAESNVEDLWTIGVEPNDFDDNIATSDAGDAEHVAARVEEPDLSEFGGEDARASESGFHEVVDAEQDPPTEPQPWLIAEDVLEPEFSEFDIANISPSAEDTNVIADADAFRGSERDGTADLVEIPDLFAEFDDEDVDESAPAFLETDTDVAAGDVQEPAELELDSGDVYELDEEHETRSDDVAPVFEAGNADEEAVEIPDLSDLFNSTDEAGSAPVDESGEVLPTPAGEEPQTGSHTAAGMELESAKWLSPELLQEAEQTPGESSAEAIAELEQDSSTVTGFMARLFGTKPKSEPDPVEPEQSELVEPIEPAESEDPPATATVAEPDVEPTEPEVQPAATQPEADEPPAQNVQEPVLASYEMMREIANKSARSAIATSTWKKLRPFIRLKACLVSLLFIVSIVLLTSEMWLDVSLYQYGVYALCAAAVAGISLMMTLLQGRRQSKAGVQSKPGKQPRKESRAKKSRRR